ncbi:MAG: hypothetical protein ABSB76_26640 [Streptosporangiaceae bacterium]
MYGTTRATQYGYSLWEFSVYGSGGGGTGCTGQSNTPNFGPNVYIFNPSESATTINNTLNTIFNTQKVNQFGTQRYAELFDPGTYTGIEDNVGYYTSVQGLGQNPSSVALNDSDVTVDSFDGTGNATDNFWRSAENMEITPSAGNDRWAVAQAGPFERMDINGGLELYPASYGYASGGYIADSIVTGQASSVSQQQYYTKDSTLGSWSGSVWNMVFSGVNGAPAQSFPSPPMTTLATTPVARDIPYLYIDSSGNYHVFEPSLRTNAVGPSWSPSSNTAGTSVPMSQFFVATPSDTAAQINAALAEGCNLLFTPGVYTINQTTRTPSCSASASRPSSRPAAWTPCTSLTWMACGSRACCSTPAPPTPTRCSRSARPTRARATRATRSRSRTSSSGSAATSPARPPTAWS